MSAFGGKADMAFCGANVRFDPKRTSACPFSSLAGLSRLRSALSVAVGVGKVRRREFIKVIGGAAATWPVAAGAQRAERMRRIGALTGPMAESDPDCSAHGRGVRGCARKAGMDAREQRGDRVSLWGGDADKMRIQAAELAALAPDVIFVAGGLGVERLLQATRTVPIVFAVVPDPLGSGFVESLSRPGGNVTGFMMFEYSLSGKWLELLKEIAPDVTRAMVLRDPAITAGIGQFAVIQSVAPSPA